MAVKAVRESKPEGREIENFDLFPMLLYNEDLGIQGFPPSAAVFRSEVKGADALLLSTTENNYSISVVLRNAIDWASRPPNQPINWKPLAIMDVTTGLLGTTLARIDLRHIRLYLNMFPLNKPEVLIARAREEFDSEGSLVDKTTKDFIREVLFDLMEWSYVFNATPSQDERSNLEKERLLKV
jgi:chromate reductase